ncbi:HAD family hydrolase [Pulveribacter suum]|uniref:phosphoglycolate phosphatase n=1 Tax=Pulveribacter suum TaxID=2116657 RepID=A0A2P1NLM1_9BURK|nr:HAD-IA family hydrolase [Pulveribacter suum]AVP57951.1 phosphoglycolate phosphatase [Pulveribacter suum]
MSAARWPGVRAVLFDLDGTLIDSAPDLGRAANQLRTQRNMPPLPLSAYRPMAGAGARGMLAIALGIQPDDASFADLREEFFDRYQGCIHEQTDVFPQVQELLATLRRHAVRWGVVTNKASRFTDLIVQRLRLFDDASAVVSGDTTPHSKPHPAPLLEAAARLELPPHACIYVGDDHRDILAGQAAGMGTVAALYGYLGLDANTTAWGADAAIDLPLELLKLLDLS